MNEELLELLSRFGLIPLDWVSASQFSALTGINEEKLTHRRKNWQEDLVWTKQDGNIYYSIKGFGGVSKSMLVNSVNREIENK